MGAKFGCNFLQPAPQINMLQPKVIITIAIKLKPWPAAGCEAKVEAELSSCPLSKNLINVHAILINNTDTFQNLFEYTLKNLSLVSINFIKFPRQGYLGAAR